MSSPMPSGGCTVSRRIARKWRNAGTAASRRGMVVLVGTMLLPTAHAAAQVTVHPTGVNVHSQGATTVFLTFGGLGTGFAAGEAFWCGELIDAAPDVGQRCDPATLFGILPARFDLARASGRGALTDIMTIPPSVARRAWQAAAAGEPAAFFYVRRFINRNGGPDHFVAVTCRLTAGGASSPLSLVDVQLRFETEWPVPVLDAETPPPAWYADISYTGTGRLVGRWEVVRPGEDLPTHDDLLPEASLPLELRGTQARYTQLDRFNIFLPPTGRVRLDGPDPARLPRNVDGTHRILLRVEAASDRDSQSSLAAVGAGEGIVASGAAAGFPLPVLQYVVGSATPATLPASALELLAPDAQAAAAGQWNFAWLPHPRAARYRLEIARDDGPLAFTALVTGVAALYRPPPFLVERVGTNRMRWRVLAYNEAGREIARSAWRELVLTP